jgi:Ca-activated chloride channel family protein
MVILMAVVCAWTPAAGQISSTQQEQTQSAKAPTVLPLLPLFEVALQVTVLDKNGKPVEGLTWRSFHVKEDGVEQKLDYLKRDDGPISIGLVIDRSGSMANKSRFVNEAAVRLLQASNPKDEFFLIGFNQHVELVTDATTLNARLHDESGAGKTALLDAIYLGLSEMKNAHNERKTLVIFSDGEENDSRYTNREVLEFAKESDVQINAFGFFDYTPRVTTEMERDGPNNLEALCHASGGEIMRVASLDSLSGLAAKMARNLRAQYVLGYSPSNLRHDKKWHKIEVTVDVPRELQPVHITTRNGYYSLSH